MNYIISHSVSSQEADFYTVGENALLKHTADRLVDEAIHFRHESGEQAGVYIVSVSFYVDKARE